MKIPITQTLSVIGNKRFHWTLMLYTYPFRNRVGLLSHITHTQCILVPVITELSHTGFLWFSQTVTIAFIVIMDWQLIHHLFAAVLIAITSSFRLNLRWQ